MPIEIKSAQTFQFNFLKNIKSFKKMIGERYLKGFVVYNGEVEQSIETIDLINFIHVETIFQSSEN